MEKRTIVTLPGDGIGKIVLDEFAFRVRMQLVFRPFSEWDIGWEYHGIKEGIIRCLNTTNWAFLKHA